MEPILPDQTQPDEALRRARSADQPDATRPAAGACSHWIGAELRYCRTTEGVRRYVQGHRCPIHTPGAPQSHEAQAGWLRRKAADQ